MSNRAAINRRGRTRHW